MKQILIVVGLSLGGFGLNEAAAWWDAGGRLSLPKPPVLIQSDDVEVNDQPVAVDTRFYQPGQVETTAPDDRFGQVGAVVIEHNNVSVCSNNTITVSGKNSNVICDAGNFWEWWKW